ncbi:hypothetical protein ABMA27_010178, partial [Loxostege sticticalis]
TSALGTPARWQAPSSGRPEHGAGVPGGRRQAQADHILVEGRHQAEDCEGDC